MQQGAGGDDGGGRQFANWTGYLEGGVDSWDEERRAGDAARCNELYDDEPRGGYGFGDAPLGRFEDVAVPQAGVKPKPAPRRRHGRGFEGTHSSREHWGEPAPGRLAPERANGRSREGGTRG